MQEVPLRRYHFAEFGSGFGCQVHRTGSKWGVQGLRFSGLRPIPHPDFSGPYGRIGKSLHNPGSMPLLSDV